MKKHVPVINIIGWSLLAVGIAMFLVVPLVLPGDYFYKFDELIAIKADLFTNLIKFSLPAIILMSVAAVALILFFVQLIMGIAKKKGRGIALSFVYLLTSCLALFAALLFLTPDCEGYYAIYSGTAPEWGLISAGLTHLESSPDDLGFVILLLAPIALIAIAFLLNTIGAIQEMVWMGSRQPKRAAADRGNVAGLLGEDVLVIHDDELQAKADEAAAKEALGSGEQPKETPAPAAAAAAASPAAAPMVNGPLPLGNGITGPLLIQYINTYAPEGQTQAAKPAEPQGNAVPVSEVKAAISGEKPLTAEDIRKLIREELGEKKETPAQPVIVTVPAPAKKETQPQGLTAEEVRAIISEEVSKLVEVEDEGDVIIEEDTEEAAPAPAVNIRDVIREELSSFYKDQDAAAAAKAAEEARKKADEEARVAEIEKAKREAAEAVLKEQEERRKAEEEEKAKEKAEMERLAAEREAVRIQEEQDAREKALEEALARAAAAEEAQKKAEEEAAAAAKAAEEAKAAAEAPKALSAEDIRLIIAEALASQPAKEEKPTLSAEDIRDIVRAEIESALPKESPAPAAAPVEPAPVVVEKVETPVEEPAEEEGGKIVRIPFPTRLLASEQSIIDHYNELKSEIMSYGVHSRVSNSGDTFRLHKVTYVKMTVAGKNVKLYLALDPKDYADTTIPHGNVGHKEIYRDIPFVFKVRSELSLRRAKQLIGDVMEKYGLNQGRIERRDWASALKDYVPAGQDSDED